MSVPAHERTSAQDITISALDGYQLAATRYDAAARFAILLMSPATGVKRSIYRAFAEHLAAAGVTTITWDWRGTFHVLMPGLTRIVGWFPSKRRRSPDYLGDWGGHEAFTAPMLVWGFSDDAYATPQWCARCSTDTRALQGGHKGRP